MNTLSATYSPDDNKLRLRSLYRLDKETYERVRAAGFIWAPKQELFVAPMWTPEREDLLLELCDDEIDDEDTSLCERAEERAERFEEYSDKRANDSARARDAVAAIADNIPLGQPILVGHHSERHARRDAERIRNGMAKAVRMWDTAKYWERRAKGALAHAKYKELPAVRMRRIKGLEADRRKQERNRAEAQAWNKIWTKEGVELTRERALKIAGNNGAPFGTWSSLDKGEITPEQARDTAVAAHEGVIARAERWLVHIDRRIAYEKAMMGELHDKMVANAAAAKKARREALPGFANWPGEGFHHMTRAEYAAIGRDYKGTRVVRGARVRTAVIHRRSVDGGPVQYGSSLCAIYLTDQKRVDPPQAEGGDEVPRFKPTDRAEIERMRDEHAVAMAPVREATSRVQRREAPEGVEEMRSSLRAGVVAVSAPQLFPTPPELAARMVKLADILPQETVLEPSAGTGNIVRAINDTGTSCATFAVEINGRLCDGLRELAGYVRCADFIECTPENLGTFNRIVMNPPFADAQDIAHIEHALKFLKPGGMLVAICANGPRQNARLGSLVDQRGGTWEELPAGTFAGTNVRAVLLTIAA